MDLNDSALSHYQPHSTLPDILVHPFTHAQVQKHELPVSPHNLTREIALTAARINNPQPHICKAIHYALADHQSSLTIFTQRMVPLAVWNHTHLIVIAQTLKKLVGVHGPFRVTERMIGQNQHGDLLLWMSSNPASNHPDHKYPNQEQTVADLASLVSQKNPILAECLLGARSLKDVIDGLVRLHPEKNLTPHGFSQRAIESADTSKVHQKLTSSNRVADFLAVPNNKNSYRNVFGAEGELNKSRTEGALGMKGKRSEHLQPNKDKPVSNVSQMDKNTKIVYNNNNPMAKSSSKHAPNRQDETEPAKLSFTDKRPFPMGNSEKGKSFHRGDAPQNGPSPKTPGQSFTGRGERGRVDITIINNNVSNYINNVTHQHVNGERTPKNNFPDTPKTAPFPKRQAPPTPGSHQFQQRKPPIPPPPQLAMTAPEPRGTPAQKNRGEMAGSFKILKKKLSQQEMRQQKTPSTALQRKDTYTEGVNQQHFNYGLEPPRRKGEKLFTFATGQDRKSPFRPKQASPFRGSPFKGNKVSPMRPQGQQGRASPFKNQHNPYKGSEYSPYKYTQQAPPPTREKPGKKSQAPPSPKESSFKKFEDMPMQQSIQKGSEIPVYHRNKTIEFGSGPKPRTKECTPTKSLTPQEISSTLQHDQSLNKTNSQDESPARKPKEDLTDSRDTAQPKSQLKKQLRQEFKFLLGEDEPETPTLKVEEKKQSNFSETPMVESLELEEGALQNKIKKKQSAFAELKKQALSLLVDL